MKNCFIRTPRPRDSDSHYRVFMGAAVIAALAASFLVSDVRSASAEEERTTPVVGSFAVGGSVTAGVDERSGTFSTQVPVGGLPGVDGWGGVSVGMSYSQDAAESGDDPHGLGVGWGWNVSRVLTDGGVQVVTPSGATYHASEGVSSDPAEMVSGLAGYVQGDLVFSQTHGALAAREGVQGAVAYSFSLEYGGGTDFFDAAGRIVARIGLFDGYGRVDWVWDGNRLIGVVDGAGSRLMVGWSDSGIEITSPPRSDGVASRTLLEVTGEHLVSVTGTTGETVAFHYDEGRLMKSVVADSGAVTQITYKPLPNHGEGKGARVVDQVRVRDSATGVELSTRTWNVVGNHNSQGSPTYSSAAEMWAAADQQYRYSTVLTDGDTRVVSEYNSMGLMLSRHIVVSTLDGEVVVQEQAFTYEGTRGGGVPPRQRVPEHYAKPVTTQVTYRDGMGRSRHVSESAVYDKTGRVVEHTAPDGAVTRTTYDTHIPEGRKLPLGLVTQQTITGNAGAASEVTNTLTSDHKSVQETQTRVASAGAVLELTSHIVFTVEADGFISEQKIIAPDGVAEGPEEVVTRFERVVDKDAKTVTVSQTDALGTTAQSTISTVADLVSGLQLSVTDPVGRVASSTYDGAGRVLSHIAPGGHTTVTNYADKVTTVTDSVGVTQNTYVDVLGQVVTVTDNIADTGGGVFGPVPGVERRIETREYEQNASKITVTNGRGLKTVTVTDVFGRPVSITGPSGVQQIKKYDDVANTVTSGLLGPSRSGLSDALQLTTTHLDDSNRETRTIGKRQDGVAVPDQTSAYDDLGRVTTQAGGDVSTSVVLNPNGTPRTTTITPLRPDMFPGEPVTANRSYDMVGVSTQKKLSRTDGQEREGVSRVLDAAGRTVSETNQTGGSTGYQYTPDGLIAQVYNDATGVTTTNIYDPVTRAVVRTETVAAGEVVSQTVFAYHPVTGNLSAGCDPTNCENTRITYTYDVYGNTTQTRYPDGKIVGHVFDEFGQEMASIDILGNLTKYVYDRVGLLKQVTQSGPDGAVLGQVGYRYDEFGRITELTRDNNVTTRYTFTSANEILTETTKQGETVIFNATYEYDAHGNLTRRVDTRPETTETNTPVTTTTTYAYNAYNQLITSTEFTGTATDSTPSQTTNYEIGVSGEVTKETVTTSTLTQTREFEYNTLGQTTAITTDGVRVPQTYDTAGNLTRATDGTTYTYNVNNQPITETHADGTTIDHTYWVTGQRNTITNTTESNMSTVTLYWDGTTLINDTHTTTNTQKPAEQGTASYLIGTSRHTRTHTITTAPDNSSTNYYVTDRHGNTTATTNNAGNITATYTYTDYGTPTEHTTIQHDNTATRNPIQYAGEYTTIDGKQHLNKRTYDPAACAFTTADTADQFNLYAYANSNPITMVDPTGQTAERDAIINNIAIGIGLIGLIFSTAVMTLPTFGASWSTFGLAIIGFILDGVDLMIATHQSIDDHVKSADFISDENSEILSWASLGIGIATLGLGLAGAAIGAFARTPGASTGTRPGSENSSPRNSSSSSSSSRSSASADHAPSSFFDALEIYGDDLDGLQAWRLGHHKNGDIRDLHHGTKTQKDVNAIIAGIQMDPVVEGSRAQLLGPGFYSTTQTHTAHAYTNRTGLGVTFNLDISKGAKIASDNGSFRLVDPRYSKTWNNDVARFRPETFRGPASATKQLTEQGYQVVHHGRDNIIITTHGAEGVSNIHGVNFIDEFRNTRWGAAAAKFGLGF